MHVHNVKRISFLLSIMVLIYYLLPGISPLEAVFAQENCLTEEEIQMGEESVSQVNLTHKWMDDDNEVIAVEEGSEYPTQSCKADYHDSVWHIDQNMISGSLKEAFFTLNVHAGADTWIYGAYEQFPENPYRIEIMDEAMFLGGNGQEPLLLNWDDYTFDSIKVSLQDMLFDYLDDDKEEHFKEKMSRNTPVRIYVMTADMPGQWQLDRELSEYVEVGEGFYDYMADGSLTISFLHEQVYGVRVSYDDSFGHTEVHVTILGRLKAEGENIQKLFRQSDVRLAELLNQATLLGFNGKGEEICCRKATEAFTLTAVPFYAGAGRSQGILTDSVDEKEVFLEYELVALLSSDSRTEENAKALVTAGHVPKSKKAVLYDLLPQGFEYEDYSCLDSDIYMDISGDGTEVWGYSPPSESGSLHEIKRPQRVTIKTEDNYKGTDRQMVICTLEYDEYPIGYIGDPNPERISCGRSYGCIYGIKLKVKSTPAIMNSYGQGDDNGQLTGTYRSLYAAQFVDEKGMPCRLAYDEDSNKNVFKDDGSYYEEMKDAAGNYAFSDLNGDGNTTDKNVIRALDTFTYVFPDTIANKEKSARKEEMEEAALSLPEETGLELLRTAGADIAITNEKKEQQISFELPGTGGAGIKKYVYVGVGGIVVALFLMLCRKYQKK